MNDKPILEYKAGKICSSIFSSTDAALMRNTVLVLGESCSILTLGFAILQSQLYESLSKPLKFSVHIIHHAYLDYLRLTYYTIKRYISITRHQISFQA